MSDPREPSLLELAGVSLNAPQALYTLKSKLLGVIRLRRSARGVSAVNGQLELEPKEGACPSLRFELSDWQRDDISSWLEGSGAHWRALLVEERLLSRPGLLIDERESARVSLTEPTAEALRGLQLHLRKFFDAPEHAWHSVVCDMCAQARRDALQAARLRAPPRSNWFETEVRERSCEHVPAARQGLEALSKAHPELAFEFLGWLVPAIDRNAGSDWRTARFVLHPDVLRVILGHWLLPQRPSVWRPSRYGSAYDYRSRHRRAYRAVKTSLPATELGISVEERAAIAFSANAWGLGTPVDELATAWRTRSGPSTGSIAPVLPSLNPSASPKMAARLLPDGVPVACQERAPARACTRARTRR